MTVLAWNVLRLWSVTAAVVMSLVAAVLPPVAVVIANWGALRDPGPRFGESPDPDR